LEKYLNTIKGINCIDDAIRILHNSIQITPLIYKAVAFSIEAHKNQFRKSG